MSIQKLTAGSGYDYLTRQVARHDATEQGHTGLASYYTERGEVPGQWVGSGMSGIDGLNVGDVVTEEQMQSLFGSGHHPLATERREALAGPDLKARDYEQIGRLGIPFKVHNDDVTEFRREVARRLTDHNESLGLPGDWPVPVQERARIRTEVGVAMFRDRYGRDPQDSRELSGLIAKESRPRTRAVAGFDLTFSPVKSVSALWALADPSLAAHIELAHQRAIGDALDFIEGHALYSRAGAGGVQQIDVQGLVATAFTHRDSRAGDPDLHTHVAIANKVQARDGRWLSIDGRVLYKATVAASETYNTALEKHLGASIGVRFAERSNPDPRKRPVREIVGVDPALNERWSARRIGIKARQGELAQEFQQRHGRPPSPIEAMKLAQQATLETRDPKKDPRTLDEQRQQWWFQARAVLGTDDQIRAMVAGVTGRASAPQPVVDQAWLSGAALRVRDAMQSTRSTWQTWHVRAEAQRQVRSLQGLPPDQVEGLVEHVVADVLDAHSVQITRDHDPVTDPSALRRINGESVYSVHGAARYTSQAVLDAEGRLVDAGGRTSRWSPEERHVDLALLESTANGITLNAGQAHLVRHMATSRASLQLAIAPAGAGKTTAMRALSSAWIEAGGTVLGLAPSASAAAVLGDQIEVPTDTLAKLVWSLEHDAANLPEWAERVDAHTMIVIDEAGMADTLSLDAVTRFALDRGASVRMIGDDQQLAAIGAGGVLRDIEASHGALRLNELMRFASPGEGAASLALREGDPNALGFYLDQGRVHVGDLATMTEEVFDSWRSERDLGRDAIMLAPTRDLVAALNERARAHRLDGADAGPSVHLSDGLEASVGDQVITRSNERRLAISSTDWVKNGDRWTVLDVHPSGALTVQHARHQMRVTLPATYVAEQTELGYASTVHGAQGVSVDACHSLVTDEISRQSLYTALTRGSEGNHVYLEVVGDGDEHNAISPRTIFPETATDILEGVLARDASPVSASTQIRMDADPQMLLGQATARYTDALYFAAEDIMGPAAATLEAAADAAVADLTDVVLSDEPAWPALRAHLLLVAAGGDDPIEQLTQAARSREITSAIDVAALLDWRLDSSGLRNAGTGPLPWLPATPQSLTQHATWGPYLSARARLVSDLAERVHSDPQPSPNWTTDIGPTIDPEVLADIQVWRAATQVDPTDLRPSGPPQLGKAARQWQRSLDSRVAGTHRAALEHWGDVLGPHVGADRRFLPVLAVRMAAISRAGVDAPAVLQRALTEGPLPDDHAASALWWRIAGHLSPAVAAAVETDDALESSWQQRLSDLLPESTAAEVQASPAWPHLVTSVERGLQMGWTLETLLDTTHLETADVDVASALTWRIAVLTDPPAGTEDPGPHPNDEPPEDLWHDQPIPEDHPGRVADPGMVPAEDETSTDEPTIDPDDTEEAVEAGLAMAALTRPLQGPLDPSDSDVDQMLRWAVEADQSPVSPERIAQVNDLAWAFFQDHLPDSWVPEHLAERFAEHARDIEAGHAPNGWTTLVDHLGGRGVTAEEMQAAGVATRSRTGNLIDRFRDRAIFPIVHDGQTLGFVGRRHPDAAEEDRKGPKYLNTADTPLFHKGAQLYTPSPHLLNSGARPVLTEGPMDAIAVTIAGQGTYVGVAPLGTSLTQAQASQLAHLDHAPIVATDADLAGRVAAERAYWMLTPHNLDPDHLALRDGSDPADLFRQAGPNAVREALDAAEPLGPSLVEERLDHLSAPAALTAAAQVLAARPPEAWDSGAAALADRLQVSTVAARKELHHHVVDWDRDPAVRAQERLNESAQVRQRLQADHDKPASEKWASLAAETDPRLPHEPDWPALANMLEHAHQEGHDVAAATNALVTADEPLGIQPAQDLRYRLAAHLPEAPTSPEPTAPALTGAREERRHPLSVERDRPTPKR